MPKQPDLEIVWSRNADRDLTEIHAYFLARSTRAARWFLRRVFKSIELLGVVPEIGRIVEHHGRSFRQVIVDHYQIFYQIENSRVVVLRLWDSRQDPEKLRIR